MAKFYHFVSFSSVPNTSISPHKTQAVASTPGTEKKEKQECFLSEVVFMWNSKDQVHF